MKRTMAITTMATLGATILWSPSAHATKLLCGSCMIEEEYTLTSMDATSMGILGAFKTAQFVNTVFDPNNPGPYYFAYHNTDLTQNMMFSGAPFCCGLTMLRWIVGNNQQALTPTAGFRIDAGFTFVAPIPPLQSIFQPTVNILQFSPEFELPGGQIVFPPKPVVNIAATTTITPRLLVLVAAATATVEGDGTTREYFEYPIGTTGAKLEFSNPTTMTETLSDVRFFTSLTGIPLSDLNSFHLPSSDFLPLSAIPDGTILGPGESVTGTAVVPESSTWAMMMLGFAGLGLAAFLRTKPRRWKVIAAVSE